MRRTTRSLSVPIALLLLGTALMGYAVAEGNDHAGKEAALDGRSAVAPAERLSNVPCTDGAADAFACDGYDLVGFVPDDTMVTYRDPLTSCALDVALGDPGAEDPTCLLNTAGLSDIWGWTSSETGDEFVIFGKTNGTAFYRVTDPTNPEYYGEIPTIAGTLLWHDVKVYGDHAYIVSESVGAGVVVFDLTQLDAMAPAPVPYLPIAPSNRFVPDGTDLLDTSLHNAVIDEDNGVLYLVGGNAGIIISGACGGGLYAMDLTADPLEPPFLGCFEAATGTPDVGTNNVYVHDAQCAAYVGPDPDHQGKDICVGSNEEVIVWVDVTDPTAMTEISRLTYANVSYAHQGWMSEDQTLYFHGDELDELDFAEVTNTRTIVVDQRDLDAPTLAFIHEHDTVSIDHNMYTHDGLLYQSNYTAGLRVFDVSDTEQVLEDGALTEVAFFDTYPDDDDAPVTAFNGTWSNYPYFASGTIAVSGIGEGLFLLRPTGAPPAGGGGVGGASIDDDTSDGATAGSAAGSAGGTTGSSGAPAGSSVGNGQLAATGGGAALLAVGAIGLAVVLLRRRGDDDA